VLTDALSWRWIFLVNVPIGVAAIVISRRRLAESRTSRVRGLDLPGLAVLCISLFLLVFALIRGSTLGWGSATILAALAGAAVGLMSFLVIELRASDPLLDLDLFRKPAFTGATLVAFCLSGSILSMFLHTTLFFQTSSPTRRFRPGSVSCRSPAYVRQRLQRDRPRRARSRGRRRYLRLRARAHERSRRVFSCERGR
jgi:MFS family permease